MKYDHVEIVRHLLLSGFPINEIPVGQATPPLVKAARSGAYYSTQLLIQFGGYVNIQDSVRTFSSSFLF